MSEFQLDPSKVYRVTSQQDDTVFLALEPAFLDGHMCWFDTLRPRMLAGRPLSHTKQSAHFRSEEGAEYRFSVLSLAAYNADVKAKVENGPTFASETELHRFYTENF